MMQCPNCQAQAEGKFCPNCGAKMPEPAFPPQGQVAAASMPTPPPAPGFQPQTPPQHPHQVYPPQGAPAFPQPGFQPGYQPAPPQKKGGVLKWILIGVGSLVGLFILLIVVVAAFLPDDPVVDPGPGTTQTISATGVTTVPVFASRVDPESQAPQDQLTEVPNNLPIFYAAFQVNAKQGQVITIRWSSNGVRPFDDVVVNVPQDYQGWVSAHVKMNEGQKIPLGTWKVEIFLDGVKATEASINVKSVS